MYWIDSIVCRHKFFLALFHRMFAWRPSEEAPQDFNMILYEDEGGNEVEPSGYEEEICDVSEIIEEEVSM